MNNIAKWSNVKLLNDAKFWVYYEKKKWREKKNDEKEKRMMKKKWKEKKKNEKIEMKKMCWIN